MRRTPAELVKVAFTTFPLAGLAVLAPLVAVAGELVDYIPFDIPEPEVSSGAWLYWFVPLAFLVAVGIGLLLNLISTFLGNWDLTVTETASGLRRNAGLLSKSSTASSITRLQLVRVSQGWLARLAGVRRVSLVGVSAAPINVPGSGGSIVVPGCSEAEAQELRRLALDGSEGVTQLDRRVSTQQVFRETRNFAFVIIPTVIGLVFVIEYWSLLLLLLVVWRWVVVRRETRLRRWGISDDAVADRRELIGFHSNETLLRKINSVTLNQSRFERKRGLATVGFVLAGGNVTIGMIPLDEAKAIRDRALYVAETDRRAFM